MLLGSASPAVTQEMPVPIPTQASIILRVLAFDRGFEPASPGQITMGILYQANLRESNRAMTDLTSALADNGTAPTGESIRTVHLQFENSDVLHDALQRHGIDVLYIAPLRAVNLGSVSEACKSVGVLTATGVPDYVERGIAVGVGSRGGRPSVLINLEAAKSVGAEFSSELLKLAEIVEGPPDQDEATRETYRRN